LLRDFNAKVGGQDIFKPTIWNESLHEIFNDNGVRTMFPHRNIHKFAWTFPDGKTHSQIDHIVTGEGIQVYLMSDRSGEQTVVLIITW
jgi:hypothetical protein